MYDIREVDKCINIYDEHESNLKLSLLSEFLGSFSPLVGCRLRGRNVEVMFFPLSCLLEGSLSVPDVVLPGPVDVVLGVVEELDPMGDPADHSGNSE